ncbi:hypothetical protein CO731_04837 [Aminobacter sp. MSH1]|nr:hypothetical protein CO731_04837 [Aminobacter sp. MSH1]
MDAKRIRFLAMSALSGFQTLGRDDAIDGAIFDLLAILGHVADDPAAIALMERIKFDINSERVVGDADSLQFVDG